MLTIIQRAHIGNVHVYRRRFILPGDEIRYDSERGIKHARDRTAVNAAPFVDLPFLCFKLYRYLLRFIITSDQRRVHLIIKAPVLSCQVSIDDVFGLLQPFLLVH